MGTRGYTSAASERRVHVVRAEAVSLPALGQLARRSGAGLPHDKVVPVKAFQHDLARKVALRKVMGKKKDDEPSQQREVLAKDKDALLPGEQFDKEQVNYRYSGRPEQSCGSCVHFKAPSACEIVAGLINQVDVCNKFEALHAGAKVGFGQAPSGAVKSELIPNEMTLGEAGTSAGVKKAWLSRKRAGEHGTAVGSGTASEMDKTVAVASQAGFEAVPSGGIPAATMQHADGSTIRVGAGGQWGHYPADYPASAALAKGQGAASMQKHLSGGSGVKLYPAYNPRGERVMVSVPPKESAAPHFVRAALVEARAVQAYMAEQDDEFDDDSGDDSAHDCPDDMKDEQGRCPHDPNFDDATAGLFDPDLLGEAWMGFSKLVRSLAQKGKKSSEVTPPGFEPVVRALKKQPGVDEPYAIAWSMYKRGVKPKQAEAEIEAAIRDPAALAAWIGRKKYGKAKFQRAAAKGKSLRGKGSEQEQPGAGIPTGKLVPLRQKEGVMSTMGGAQPITDVGSSPSGDYRHPSNRAAAGVRRPA